MNAPTLRKERIISLDVLRGFALLGILIINIQSFAMPGSAYLNPSSYGDFTGINKIIWGISHVLADTKMMAIFSTLFGAGVLLVIERARAKKVSATSLHYKRMGWLLIFGLIHAHLIWYGDILVAYAICGMFIFLFRNKSPKTLIIVGISLMAVKTLLTLFLQFSFDFMTEQDIADLMKDWRPSLEAINEEIALRTGSISQQIAVNSKSAVMLETLVFGLILFWRASGLMLIGMALYKLNILSAQRTIAFYKKGLLIGWTLGFPLVLFGVYQNFDHNWSVRYSMFAGTEFNYWGSLGVSFGYICLIMLMVKNGTFQWLQKRLAALGQMAFTNYISQSVICVFIFWGVGFGLLGQLSRGYQILIVIAIWVVQLMWSKPWLERYRFGPLEWLWRSLTYGKMQSMKKR